ncbi:hypothetical protein NDR87_16205 [Nocardia sp. CDC159]|uniref:ABC3 transporter permease C-terminal domain-containing protein n=1 Tax=Nocardia pulmonis TaxID=2951408 RepID=A0A9X2EBY6_9NOCA|nr:MULTISPECIES: FtsX-like permease family protein [Nocardia]MCM6775363.1 hypothetical protein [Nocardia pulmonis]MCM6787903.1 hypothetical protein [Nocardia sp. CDC159]
MIEDLLLGLRLAFAGRGSGAVWSRLGLTTIGLGLATAVLLGAVSVAHAYSAQRAREVAKYPDVDPRAGVAPLFQSQMPEDIRVIHGTEVRVYRIAAAGSNAPVPPGLSRLPAPGELVVSPAVARAFASSRGAAFRAHIPGTVIGEIGRAGLVETDSFEVYAGAPLAELAAEPGVMPIYGFGLPIDDSQWTFQVRAVLAVAAAALLASLLIFVIAAARMGAVQRDRRLAALRLLGLEAHRVRRVAAGEALIGAVAGLILGAGLFLAYRPAIADIRVHGTGLSEVDLIPPLAAVGPIALLIPVLAVAATIFGLRRTAIEPLGVVRQSEPMRRRTWWRFAILGAGVVLMLSTLRQETTPNPALALLTLFGGSVLLLAGVAALLPWLVERLVRRGGGGAPSWQLAVRRLQLDSGTPSRVVSGLVVVLAGAILVHVVASVDRSGKPDTRPVTTAPAAVVVRTDGTSADEVVRRLAIPEVTAVHAVRSTFVGPATDSIGRGMSALIGDCAALAVRVAIGHCADGDVFMIDPPTPQDSFGRPWSIRSAAEVGVSGDLRFGTTEETSKGGPIWTLPSGVRHIPAKQAARHLDSTLLITPGALHGIDPRARQVSVYVNGPGAVDALADRVATALTPLTRRAAVLPSEYDSRPHSPTYRVHGVILAVSLLMLLVAAGSLLLHAVEQIGAQRRALAALTAAGVPLSVLARVFLWQNAIPLLLGIALAVATAIGLAIPTMRLADSLVALDPGLIGVLVAAAILACVVVTALTVPLLREATRLEALRTE